jgi:tRNA threonylcarbamoyladenosine biosynthesis protein TsaB
VDCYAAAAGPGSFTGVRVGLAAVKGLAEAASKPVAPVSNLRALAWYGSGALRATLLDARRGEIYGAVYDAALKAVVPETVGRFPDWLAALPDGDVEFVSPDFGPFRASLARTRFEAAPVVETPRTLAVPVARIALDAWRMGVLEDPVTVDANYIRRSDAERLWNDPAL